MGWARGYPYIFRHPHAPSTMRRTWAYAWGVGVVVGGRGRLTAVVRWWNAHGGQCRNVPARSPAPPCPTRVRPAHLPPRARPHAPARARPSPRPARASQRARSPAPPRPRVPARALPRPAPPARPSARARPVPPRQPSPARAPPSRPARASQRARAPRPAPPACSRARAPRPARACSPSITHIICGSTCEVVSLL